MRHYGYTSRRAPSQCVYPEQELTKKPFTEHEYRWNGQEKDKDQCQNSSAREQQNVGPHNSRDGATGPKSRYNRVEIEKCVSQSRTDPADDVKKQIWDMAEKVLHVVAEDPQEKHVPGNVEKSGMQEHACENWQKRHFKCSVPCKKGRDAGRHSGVARQERDVGFGSHRELQAQLIEEERHVGDDERDVDERVGSRGVDVF